MNKLYLLLFLSHLAFSTCQTQAQVILSVERFGANGNDTLDDSKAFQKAIDYASSKKQKLYVPKGNYYLADVKLKSNLTIYGDGETSVIRKIYSGIYGFGCNFSYPDVGDPNGLKKVENVVISKLTFVGTSTSDGFFEHKHLVNLNGVKNVTVSDCKFYAFNGDGVYIGSGVGVEKHNKNVRVVDCYFDGVNKQNRNAVSVIDGDSITIMNNKFFNTSRDDMPGAIDVEPDANRYHIVRNIRIENNYFEDINGNVAAISIFIPLSQQQLFTPAKNISIVNNYLNNVKSGIGVFQRNEAGINTPLQNVTISGNTVVKAEGFPLAIYGMGNVLVHQNTFKQFNTNVYIGAPDRQYQVYKIKFLRNWFKENKRDGVAISLKTVDDFISEENVFEDIGLETGNFGVAILGETGGKSKSVKSIKDVLLGDNTTAFSTENIGHTTIPSLNVFEKSSRGKKQLNAFRFKKQ